MALLHEMIKDGNDIDHIREVLGRGGNPNFQDHRGLTPLHIAILKSEINPQMKDQLFKVVVELIRYGANVNLGNRNGYTPLHVATMCRDCKMIETLLLSGAHINQQDKQGYAALHHATVVRDLRGDVYDLFCEPELRVVQLLLRHSPNLDIRNQADETPLMLAAKEHDSYIVHELLQKNASVNLTDSLGNSAMHYALDSSELVVDIVLELAKYGGSFSITNNAGDTPRKIYFDKLSQEHPIEEVEKAKQVFKLLMIRNYEFEKFESNCIKEISKANKNCKLSRFLNHCVREIRRMSKDKLARNYSVLNMALRGGYSIDFRNADHIPLEVFNEMIYKLIRRRKYTVFCDLIAAGICRPYMRAKFVKDCCSTKTGVEIFQFDNLYLLSSYLSHLDMINTIIAFSPASRPGSTPRSTQTTNCSIL